MFSVASRFSSPAFFIRLGGFSPSPHFTSTIPCSTELASKKRGNCNNMTSGEFPKRKSRDNNHPKLHPGQFDLLRDISSSWAPTWSRSTFSPYALISSRTCLLMHSSSYVLVLPLRPCTSRKNIPHRYLSEIIHLSRRHLQSLQYLTKKLSCRLDAINAPSLCDSQPRHQYWPK